MDIWKKGVAQEIASNQRSIAGGSDVQSSKRIVPVISTAVLIAGP